MKRRRGITFVTILVMVLSLCISTASMYPGYVDLSDGNLHSVHETFKNLDEENVTGDHWDDLHPCESQRFFDVLILQTASLGQPSFACVQQPHGIQRALVLGC